MQKPQKKTYTNGLRVVTVPMKDNPTVTVLVLVGTGSDYETKRINGISHFLEHMCFKGTAKRPTPQSISHELDALGAQYNAFTDHQVTGYYAKADSKHFKKIFDVVSDIYLNSTFPESEIEKEKGVIVEEINMYEDMPQRHVQDMFQEALYGDQPAGWNIAGSKETVRAMTREDFVSYKKAHYVAEGTVIVVAGSVTKTQVEKEVATYFSNIPHTKKAKKVKTKESQNAPHVLLKHKATDQTHFVLGFRTFDVLDKRNTTISVLSAILGAGMSSRLFIKLREEMGVAYYVRAFNEPSIGYGSFQISAGVNNARTEEVLQEILKECDRLKKEKISEAELKKVKSLILGNMKLSLELTDDIATYYGSQELLTDKMKTVADRTRLVMAVTPQDIQKMAQKIFTKKNITLAMIGPKTDTRTIMPLLTL
ncbi:MAG: insulinase family protein [Candidatus Pacebacteria bacterium]|jgi:predicted Zn-dependent peptidase|nr:insulinase family protein [Candidatus Paceibacterota bacterium]